MLRPRSSRLAPLLLLAAGPAACATAGSSSLDRLARETPVESRGHYTASTGASWFRPCGAASTDAAWWVTLTDGAGPQLDAAREAGRVVAGRPSFVRWRAVLTRGGEVGPKGGTALLVREIVETRPAAEGDCAAP